MAITTNTKNLSDLGMSQADLTNYFQHLMAFTLAMKAILVSGGTLNATNSSTLDAIMTSGAELKGNLSPISTIIAG